MDLCEGVKRDLGSGRDLGMALLASPKPKLSVPDIVSQLWSKICATNPRTESLGLRLRLSDLHI